MCTGIKLLAKNGAPIYARTLEFGQNIESKIIIIPRNYSFIGTPLSRESAGMSWQSKYAAVGTNALGLNHILDGVNEKGLAGGIFYFPHYAQYQDVASQDYNRSLAPWELLTWLLTNFATVNEAKTALPTIFVSNTVYKPWNMVPPVHFIVHDVSGASLVIEYLQGKLVMHDNPLGVITNAPQFEWHMMSLNNYLHLSPINRKNTQLNSVTLTSFGQGSGMLGLPGDFTPPSRFVRATFFSQTAFVGNNEDEARQTAFRILNLFNIPKGIIQDVDDDKTFCDYTQWTSACDLKNARYYYHTYEDARVRTVDLRTHDLNAREPIIMEM